MPKMLLFNFITIKTQIITEELSTQDLATLLEDTEDTEKTASALPGYVNVCC